MIETKCLRDAFGDQLHELSGQPNMYTYMINLFKTEINITILDAIYNEVLQRFQLIQFIFMMQNKF